MKIELLIVLLVVALLNLLANHISCKTDKSVTDDLSKEWVANQSLIVSCNQVHWENIFVYLIIKINCLRPFYEEKLT